MKDASYVDNFSVISHEISHILGVSAEEFDGNVEADGGFDYLASPNVK
jgi:hypothetical protein